MSLKNRIDEDLKQAMLARDAALTMTLRSLKGVILDTEIAKGAREQGLPDEEVITLLQKEAKKRQESADLYKQGGNQEKAEQELAEKTTIETYLPKQLSEEEIAKVVHLAIMELSATDPSQMGAVIGKVKQLTKGAADGAVIARLTKEALSK